MARTPANDPAADEAESKTAPAESAQAEKTPEQALADQLELARFVERLRRKFH